ncbi:MAG: DUF5627 domain-containing protein [Cyclobacteriaceae bacterium]
MKRILAITGTLLLSLGVFVSCQNDEWEFPDFDYTTAYFPYQFPVRTLVLGDYNFDNSNDNEHKFMIGATMGGVYKNEKDVTVDFVVDETLTANLYNSNTGGLPIKAMPANYYTLASNQIVIPIGQTYGMVEVQLTDAFFADTLSIGQHYVIPLRMVSASTDSILQGKTSQSNPDPRIPADWVLAPKDFTLFGVRYVNEYHGKYLLRGGSEVRDNTDTPIDTIVYRQDYLEKNPVVTVSTLSLNSVYYSNTVRLSSGSPGSFKMEITFDEDGNGVITNSEDAPAFPVTGTSRFIKDAEEWGNEKRHVIYLDYQIAEGTNIHHVADTLVFRDKAVKFEEFKPVVQ